jgi:hypothetical protein
MLKRMKKEPLHGDLAGSWVEKMLKSMKKESLHGDLEGYSCRIDFVFLL